MVEVILGYGLLAFKVCCRAVASGGFVTLGSEVWQNVVIGLGLSHSGCRSKEISGGKFPYTVSVLPGSPSA